ncbi:MAG: TRAP transporter permease [Inquilinaceae bacterium]
MTATQGAASGGNPPGRSDERIVAAGVDEELPAGNQRSLTGWQGPALFWVCVVYTVFHLVSLNVYPLETWAYRILHIAGGLVIGFALMAAWSVDRAPSAGPMALAQRVLMAIAVPTGVWALFCVVYAGGVQLAGGGAPPSWVFAWFGVPLTVSVVAAIAASWLSPAGPNRVPAFDWVLVAGAISVAGYLLVNLEGLRLRAGVMALAPDFWATLAGVLLIMELTRRAAGLALVGISAVFLAYSFLGPYLPGFLTHRGYAVDRFFTYLYTDNGILGAPIAVSSTYIILFIAFAAFLQASKVGDYFVNFAFAAAGTARGGPAKVAVFASGLMGMINGTSAGNVVATGSLTIPLMKRVGYRPQSAAAIEAAASTGGQIMPPIMGAGVFIMAEITEIPYTELMVAGLLPAILYFWSIFMMVDFEAVKTGMKGLPRSQLPEFGKLARQAYLFIPIIILIGALFSGYTVIRSGTLALLAAVAVSWLTAHRMGPRRILDALALSATMAVQLVAVCACAGIIVGVIALTGVGARFSSLLLGVAETSQLLAMIFAMGIAIMLGMGMPTTAAYAVAAAVVAPGLIQLGIQPLVAHFFVFYFAVISAITPPVALAAYAASAISGSDPMRTSVTSFKLGLAAYIVPFMFFYSPAMLMEGDPIRIVHVFLTAIVGIYLLAGAVQGWFFGRLNPIFRVLLLIAALLMIKGGLATDAAGIAIGLAVALVQQRLTAKTAVAER